jgi:hypothetical protein
LLFKEPPPALFVDGSRTNTATAATYRLTDLRQWGKRLAALYACCGAHLIAADQRRQQREPWHKRPRTTTTGANNPIVSYPGHQRDRQSADRHQCQRHQQPPAPADVVDVGAEKQDSQGLTMKPTANVARESISARMPASFRLVSGWIQVDGVLSRH